MRAKILVEALAMFGLTSHELWVAIFGALVGTTGSLTLTSLSRIKDAIGSVYSPKKRFQRRIESNDYKLYHVPLAGESRRPCRLSTVRISCSPLGIFRAEISDAFGKKELMHAGSITFEQESIQFVLASAHPSTEGSSKTIKLTKPLPDEDKSSLVLIGFVTGLNFFSSPYSVPVLLTNRSLSISDATRILKSIDKNYFDVGDRKRIRDEVLACRQDISFSGFGSVYSHDPELKVLHAGEAAPSATARSTNGDF